MERAFLTTGLVLIWASVVAIMAGTYFQNQSPRFNEFWQEKVRREAGGGPEERLNFGGRIALGLSVTWPFMCCFSGFFACLFTAGAFGIRAIGRRHRDFSLLAAGAFGLGCLVGAVDGAGQALEVFQWGFLLLGIGFLLSSAGLAVGGLGVVWSCFKITDGNRPGSAF